MIPGLGTAAAGRVGRPAAVPRPDEFSRAGVDRDHRGRPKIPDPVTGQERTWTRVTTLAGTIEDTRLLDDWGRRMTAKGIALRDDLRALAAAADPDDPDGKKELQQAADDAKEHAGGSSGANLGTALHSFCRRVTAGTLAVGDVPREWRPMVESYCRILAEAKVTLLPEYSETLVVSQVLGTAGSFDHPGRCEVTGRLLITDLKTGPNELNYGHTKTSAQLAAYAYSETIWDAKRREHLPHLPVDQSLALIIHVPSDGGPASVRPVDLVAGWQNMQLALAVRERRKVKTIGESYSPPGIWRNFP